MAQLFILNLYAIGLKHGAYKGYKFIKQGKNMIKLYHYSNKDFKGYINPSYFGINNYTNNSAKISNVKRCYFYINKKEKEFFFYGTEFCYIAEIKEEVLYNLNEDSLNIVKNLKYDEDIHIELIRRGFKGLIGDNGFKCAVLFYPVKIKERLKNEIS